MKIIYTPEGGEPIHVAFQEATYQSEGWQAAVEVSYADASLAPGGMNTGSIQYIAIPNEAMVLDSETTPAQAALNCLVGESGLYAGGELVSDEAFEFVSARYMMKRAVKAKRDAVEHGGITTTHGPIDTDCDSQRKINGAVTMALVAAQASEAFAMDWRMADDTIANLDGAEMIAVGVAVGQHVAACQARKNVLDALLDAAEDMEDLDAIDTDSGWPS